MAMPNFYDNSRFAALFTGNYTDIRKVTVHFGVVESVADNELIGDRESHIVAMNI
jgi:ferredoxin-fold anticodon binding domain-containing protein